MFNKVLEQDLAYEFFEKVFQSKKLVRSYLFLGDNSLDKKDFAYELTKILNCEKNKRVWLDKLGNNVNQNTLFAVEEANYQAACGVCQNCLWLNEQSHPKTPIFVEGSGAKNTIQVETVRKLQEELSQSSEHFRVIVFENASNQVLNKSSSAALLKTIEEANPNTMFLFFADSKENVLSTIVSRCQYLQFKPSLKQEVSEEALELKNKIFEFINSANLRDELERVNFSEELANEERDVLLEAFSTLQKDLSEMNLSIDQAKAIFACEELIFDIRAFVKTKAAIKDAFDKIARLNLELSFEPA